MHDNLIARFSSLLVMGLYLAAPWCYGQEATAEDSPPPATAEYVPHVADNAQVPEGFTIEKIFDVPRSMGSWVSLAVDPQGRLIASDQGSEGLFLITPGRVSNRRGSSGCR